METLEDQINDPPRPKRSWWGRNWVWVVPVGCLTPVVLCAGCITILITSVFGFIKSSEPYTKSVSIVQGDERVREALGEPVEVGFVVAGNVNIVNSSGEADLSYDVDGPKGSGTVMVIAEREDSKWKFMKLDLIVDETGEEIDLLEPADSE